MSSIKHTLLYVLVLLTQAVCAQTFTKYADTLKLAEYTNLTEALKEPEKVQRLVLKNKRLNAIPPEVFQFINLVELDLRGNRITAIPAGIAQLKKLRYLNLSRNNIDTIPAAVGNLQELMYVEFGQNQIRYISPNLKNAINLQYMSLWENELSSLPALNKLEKLKEVDMRSILLTQSQRDEIKEALPEKTVIHFSPDCNCGK